MTLAKFQDPALIQRALAAYFRYAGGIVDQPASNGVTIHEIDGLHYITVANGHRVLDCYRVRNDGKLKRLVRVPAELRGVVVVATHEEVTLCMEVTMLDKIKRIAREEEEGTDDVGGCGPRSVEQTIFDLLDEVIRDHLAELDGMGPRHQATTIAKIGAATADPEKFKASLARVKKPAASKSKRKAVR